MGYFPAQEIFTFTQFGAFFRCQDMLDMRFSSTSSSTYNTLVINLFLHIVILLSTLLMVKQLIVQREKTQERSNTKILLLIWFFPYFIFTQLYCAFEIHFKLFYILPLLAIWAIQITESTPKEFKIWNKLVAVFVIAMFGWNFFTGALPDTRPDRNPFLREVLRIEPYLKKNDLLIYANHERYKAALARYYTDADAVFFQKKFRYISTDESKFDEMNKETIEFFKNRYARIILSKDATESGYQKWFFSSHLFPPPHPDFLAISKSELESGIFLKDGRNLVIVDSDLLLESKGIDSNP
jgi:hypothetical protein